MEEGETGLPPLFNDVQWVEYDSAPILYGILAPVVILWTLINNAISIIIFFIDPNDIDPTSIQATGVLIPNTLIGIFQLPIFIHFFSAKNFAEESSFHWCSAYRIMGYTFPFILHVTSKWQLIGLSLQRLLCYRFPHKAVVWYNDKLMLKITVTLSLLAVIFGFCRFFDFEATTVQGLNNSSKEYLMSCLIKYRYGIDEYTYQNIYGWMIALFVHIIPCFLLLVVFILLIIAVRALYLKRAKLANNRRNLIRARRRTMHEACTPVLLTLVLLVEIPSSVVRVRHTFKHLKDNEPLTTGNDIIITHFLTLISFPFYMYIYLIFNRRFKQRFKRLFRLLQNEPDDEQC